MPPLPVDPHAAMVEVRRLLAEQMAPLLADSGQRWTDVRFMLTTSETDETAYQGYLFVTVSGTAGNPADGRDPPERLGTAARARGWDDGGVSHLLNVIRGPYHLRSTVRPGDEYRYELSTPPLNPRTLIEGTGNLSDETDRTEGVPELAAQHRRVCGGVVDPGHGTDHAVAAHPEQGRGQAEDLPTGAGARHPEVARGQDDVPGDGRVLRDVVDEKGSALQPDAREEGVVVVVGAVRSDVDEVVGGERRGKATGRAVGRGDGRRRRPGGGHLGHLTIGQREARPRHGERDRRDVGALLESPDPARGRHRDRGRPSPAAWQHPPGDRGQRA